MFFYLLLIAALSVSSQGLINDGGYINIGASGWVHVDGDALGMYSNYTNGSYDGTIDIEGTLEVEGNWTNDAVNNVFINRDRDGTVLLDGTTRQIIGGTTPTFFENLTVDNMANVQMNVDNSANGILFLINGVYILNSHTMTIDNIPTNAISRINGYITSETIDGDPNPCYSRINWVVQNGTGVYVIPFGTYTASFIPFQFEIISAGSGNGGIIVSTYHSAIDNTPYADYPSTVTNINDPWGRDNTPNTADRYWLVDYSGFASNPTATLQVTFDGTTDSDTITESNLQAQAWDGTQWLPLTGTADDINNTVGNITGIDNSYVWTLSNYANPPLPIELVFFNAICNEENVKLLWTTASETNNDFFSVERSSNAVDWENVLNVNGAGNSNQPLSYQAWDNEPLNVVSYYRLKQTDFDGSYAYSEIVTTYCNNSLSENSILNTSQNGEMLFMEYFSADEQLINICLYNIQGQIVKALYEVPASEGANHFVLDVYGISQGIYMLTAADSAKISVQKIMVR
ncbi:MAG: T9SS type A sorting domain-containing protein [Bacteroidota bacterium]